MDRAHGLYKPRLREENLYKATGMEVCQGCGGLDEAAMLGSVTMEWEVSLHVSLIDHKIPQDLNREALLWCFRTFRDLMVGRRLPLDRAYTVGFGCQRTPQGRSPSEVHTSELLGMQTVDELASIGSTHVIAYRGYIFVVTQSFGEQAGMWHFRACFHGEDLSLVRYLDWPGGRYRYVYRGHREAASPQDDVEGRVTQRWKTFQRIDLGDFGLAHAMWNLHWCFRLFHGLMVGGQLDAGQTYSVDFSTTNPDASCIRGLLALPGCKELGSVKNSMVFGYQDPGKRQGARQRGGTHDYPSDDEFFHMFVVSELFLEEPGLRRWSAHWYFKACSYQESRSLLRYLPPGQ